MENKELEVHVKYIVKSIDEIKEDLYPKVNANTNQITKLNIQNKMLAFCFTISTTVLGWFNFKG